MAAAAAAVAATPVAAPGCVEGLCGIRALDPWFGKLARAARTEGRPPLHILQIGDSHTAGDTITGPWRDSLQLRYGSGGRGVLPPGKPWRGYFVRGMTAEMSDGWSLAATFGPGSAEPRPPMGLSGFSLTSQRAGARIALTADAGAMFDRLVVCAIARPRAGALRVTIGGVSERMNLDSAIQRPECRTLRTPQPQFTAEVVAEGSDPVTITSWATFRDAGGVAVSNLGVSGSQLVHFARTDDAVLAEELRAYKPDLIVLAFGTNEGFSPVFRPSEYEVLLRTQIGRLRRLSGGTPILLIGAPDASSRRAVMLHNAPGPTPPACPEPVVTVAPPPAPVPPPPESRSPIDEVMADLRGSEGDIAEPPPPARRRAFRRARALDGARQRATVSARRPGVGTRCPAPGRRLARRGVLGLERADGRRLLGGALGEGRSAADAWRLCAFHTGGRATARRAAPGRSRQGRHDRIATLRMGAHATVPPYPGGTGSPSPSFPRRRESIHAAFRPFAMAVPMDSRLRGNDEGDGHDRRRCALAAAGLR
jgi:hypothetical protein